MQILCIKLEQLWWYIAELSCIHPASALWKVFQCWDMASYYGAQNTKMYTNCQKDTVLITKFLSHFLLNSKNFIHHCFFSNSDHFATLTLILDSGSNETKFERVDRVGNCDRVIMEYTINNYVIYRPMYKLYTPPSEFWIPLHGNKELADVFRLILLSEHITVREGG